MDKVGLRWIGDDFREDVPVEVDLCQGPEVLETDHLFTAKVSTPHSMSYMAPYGFRLGPLPPGESSCLLSGDYPLRRHL